jgi:hypothetical protein
MDDESHSFGQSRSIFVQMALCAWADATVFKTRFHLHRHIHEELERVKTVMSSSIFLKGAWLYLSFSHNQIFLTRSARVYMYSLMTDH